MFGVLRAFGHLRGLSRNARLYLLSNAIQAVTAGAIAVLYTLYLTALGYHQDFIGLTLALTGVGGGLGIIPATPLVTRLGWRAMLLWSSFIGGLAIFLQIVLPTAPVILLTSLAVGASIAIILVINAPILAATSTPGERTALFAVNNALNFLTAVIGSLLGGFLPELFMRLDAERAGWLLALRPLLVAPAQARALELALLAAGVISLPSLIPIFAIRDERAAQSAPPVEQPAREQSARASAPGAAPAESQVGRPPLRDNLRRLRHRGARELRELVADARRIATGLIGRFTLTQALTAFGAGLFLPYVTIYFRGLRASYGAIGGVSAAYTGALALASLASVPLAARFGRRWLAIGAQLASIPFLLALGLPALPVVFVAYLLRGFLMSLTSAPLQAYYMEAVPEPSRVLASSVYNVCWQVAGLTGASLGGPLNDSLGNRLTFAVAAPFYALSALLLLFWFRPPARHPGEGPPPAAQASAVTPDAGASALDSR